MKLGAVTQRNAIIIVVGLALTALAGLFVANSTIGCVLNRSATNTALAWANYLGENLTDVESIAAGQTPNAESLVVLDVAQHAGDVFRFKMFDANGHLSLISDDLAYRFDGATHLAEHNATAAHVLVTGEPYTDVRQGDGVSRPLHYTEAYVPLTVDGRTIGVIEVYVDQTAIRASITTALHGMSGQLLLVLVLAFGLPALAFMQVSQEHATTQDTLHKVSRFDGLTGALNRSAFHSELDGVIDGGEAVSVYCLDLDHFKHINDLHGQEVGDAVLQAAAERLQKAVGQTGRVGRLSGDEFVIFQPFNSRPTNSCAEFAELLLGVLKRPFQIDHRTIATTSSLGLAASPHHGTGAADLIQSAGVALAQAKAENRGEIVRYNSNLNAARIEKVELEALLRTAVQDKRFELHYQPQFEAQSSKLVGFEALLRLKDHKGQPVSPSHFVPLAEQLGLIEDIGAWVLNQATAFAALWPDSIKVAINLSPLQFQTDHLAHQVGQALLAANLPGNRVELEITESLLLGDAEPIARQLQDLRQMGVSIALDDFGTGYSSLNYLWQFPFDRLKIDRSLVKATNTHDEKAFGILSSIVSLAQSLGLSTTAEGVETQAQLAMLQNLNCSHIQGFLLGRPLHQNDVAAFILAHNQPYGRDDTPAPITQLGTRRA